MLVVVAYGMAFRNLALNETLWRYLVTTFAVDLLTPMAIRDGGALDIARVHHHPAPSRVRAAITGIRRRAAGALAALDRVAFYMHCGEVESLRAVYRYSAIDGSLSRLFLWSWLGHSALAGPIRRLARRVAATDLSTPSLDGYDFVLLTHNAEPLCMAYGVAANALGIPVICIPMGLDNLMHGPLVFVPDLFLLWGPEQDRDLDLQAAFNPQIRTTASTAVGSTTHDAYLACSTGPDVNARYDLAAGDGLILFPAYSEKYGDNQLPVCRLLLELIRRAHRPIKLLVRTRPGFDEDLWKSFQRANPDEVRLQMPVAASYDKSGSVRAFDLDREREEVALLAATLRRCDVLVTPTFSTMEMDAMLFGKPAINAIFDPERPDAVHPLLAWFQAGRTKVPEWEGMRVVTSSPELIMAVERVLAGQAPLDASGERLFRYRATARDGRAGERAIGAVAELTRQRLPDRS